MDGATNTGVLEVKSVASSDDLTGAFEEFMMTFETFKHENDQRLKEIERRSADPLTTEKVERLSAVLDEQKRMIDHIALKKVRPALGGEGVIPPAVLEHKEAFQSYIRSGDDQQLRGLEEKAMSYGSQQDGGYLVPEELEVEIGKRLAAISPIRSIASVRQVSSAVLKKPFAIGGPATGWVGETAPRPETAADRKSVV